MVNKCHISISFTARPLLVEDSAAGYLTHQETVKCFMKKKLLLFLQNSKAYLRKIGHFPVFKIEIFTLNCKQR